jgi:diguanylate cyclase (GGDEF)-like protein
LRNTKDRVRRSAPFAIAGLVALASTLLPPGPRHPEWLLVAVALAVALALDGVLGFSKRAPVWVPTVQLLVTVTAITVVAYAAGPSSGLTALLLLPVIFSALYGKPWEAAFLIPAVVVADTFIWAQSTSTPAALFRSLAVYTGIALLVTVATHGLRQRLSAALGAADERARQLAIMANAAQALNSLDPDEVMATASHLAAILVSPHGEAPRRGQYFLLDGDEMVVAADSDEVGISLSGERWPIEEHPAVAEAVRLGRTTGGPIDLDGFGPHVRSLVQLSGITHSAYALVRIDGQPLGILSASSRGSSIADDLVERLGSLAHLTELALANAMTHRGFQRQATVDALTDLSNRRGFDLALRRISGRTAFAILAIDVDGLKAVNDRWGHAHGDRLIVGVGTALAGVIRRGDTLARVGGDEFAALVLDASDEAITQLEARMHAAVTKLTLESGPASISIGAALGEKGEQPQQVYERADGAMYRAKRLTHAVRNAPPEAPPPALVADPAPSVLDAAASRK